MKKVRKNSRFGARIDSVKRLRRKNSSSPRTNVYNSAALLLQHPGQQGMRDPRHRLNIHLDEALHKLLIHFMEVLGIGIGDPSVVHKNPNIQPINRLQESLDAIIKVSGEVNDHSLDLNLTVLGKDLIRDGGKLVWVAGDEDEVKALAGELEREGLADAFSAAGDDGPGAVAPEILGGTEEDQVEPQDEGEGELEDVEEAKEGEEKEP